MSRHRNDARTQIDLIWTASIMIGLQPSSAQAVMCAVLSAKTGYASSLRPGLHRGMRRAGDHARFWMLSVIVAG